MWVEQVGALHVHTCYSDGSLAISEIAAAAERCALDFVLLSDHDTLAARREGWEGKHGRVTVLVASEITPAHRGHVLAMDVDECYAYATAHNTHVLDAIMDQGGYAIVAHPQGKRKAWLRINHKPWYNWDHPVISGLEIWSYTHDWVDEVHWWRFPQLHTFCHYPERLVSGPEPEILRLWDTLGRKRRMSGLAGLDCHARRIPFLDVRIFPYERMFRYVLNHMLIPGSTPPEEQPAALWKALKEGRGFVAHDILCDARGTRCWAETARGEMTMGEEASFAPGISMHVALPREAEISWIVNGRTRLKQWGRRLSAEAMEPGVYRFEARLQGRPWIFTNPFYLR